MTEPPRPPLPPSGPPSGLNFSRLTEATPWPPAPALRCSTTRSTKVTAMGGHSSRSGGPTAYGGWSRGGGTRELARDCHVIPECRVARERRKGGPRGPALPEKAQCVIRGSLSGSGLRLLDVDRLAAALGAELHGAGD